MRNSWFPSAASRRLGIVHLPRCVVLIDSNLPQDTLQKANILLQDLALGQKEVRPRESRFREHVFFYQYGFFRYPGIFDPYIACLKRSTEAAIQSHSEMCAEWQAKNILSVKLEVRRSANQTKRKSPNSFYSPSPNPLSQTEALTSRPANQVPLPKNLPI